MCRLDTAAGMAKIRLSFFVSVSRAVRPPGVVSIAFSTPEFSPADSTLRGFLLYRLCLIIVVMEKYFILKREFACFGGCGPRNFITLSLQLCVLAPHSANDIPHLLHIIRHHLLSLRSPGVNSAFLFILSVVAIV